MVVGGSQPVLLDVANRAEHLLRCNGQTPRGSERPCLEESRDRVRPQQTAASNSRCRQFSTVGVCARVDPVATNIERTTTILLRGRL